jgi:hypothetical protein
MKRFILPLLVLTIASCSILGKGNSSKSSGRGDTRTKDVTYLDPRTYQLTETATDDQYGYVQTKPVDVGGVPENNGPANERAFLNALLGPNGEQTAYYRSGSCCQFKTPHGFMNDMGLLDVYKVYVVGAKDTSVIYINMYDKGDLYIPKGFTAKK